MIKVQVFTALFLLQYFLAANFGSTCINLPKSLRATFCLKTCLYVTTQLHAVIITPGFH